MAFPIVKMLSTSSGTVLALRHAKAQGAPRAVIHIHHGLAEHSARYGYFAKRLAERGFHIYAHDHRGHGETKAIDAARGIFSSHDGAKGVLDDVGVVNSFIRDAYPGLPIIIFGHSMGGLIALNYVLRQPETVHAAAIWNTNILPRFSGRLAYFILDIERFLLGSDVPSRIFPKLTFRHWACTIKNRRTEFDWLSHDPLEVDSYIADPNCGWDATVGMWNNIFEFILYAADNKNFNHLPRTMPFHLVGGAEDPVTDNGKTIEKLARRMRTMGFHNVVEQIYPITRHESLHEINRDIIIDDFIAWATEMVKSSEPKP